MTDVESKPEGEADAVPLQSKPVKCAFKPSGGGASTSTGKVSSATRPTKRGVTFAAGTIETDKVTQRPKPGQPVRRKQVNINNIKKENLARLIQKKKECERQAHEIVLRLIETDVEQKYLLDNAIRISQHHLEDVIEERKLSKLCGWVLCDSLLDPEKIPKQTYSIRANKVYNITDRKAYCRGECYAKSIHFKAQLLTSPLWLRELEEDVHFEILEEGETEDLHGLNVALTSVQVDDESEEENDVEGVEEQLKSTSG